MPSTIKLIAQQIDMETDEVTNEQVVYNKLISAPTKINHLGFTHTEQIKIIENSQEAILQAQEMEINKKNLSCPICGKKTRKDGKFKSAFHAVFTDHKVILQRTKCSCGWSSKISIDGTYGSALHPDLVEMQALYGADNSFKKVEEYFSKKCCAARPINNHSRIQKTVTQIGGLLSNLKQTKNWVAANERTFSKELILNVDGGHIHSNDVNKRSFEAIVATVYNPKNIEVKDKNHRTITDKTVVASAKDDHQATLKKLITNACQQQGMQGKTKLTILSDGAKNCWSAVSGLEGKCASITKILDWFHIGKKFKNTQSVIPEELKDNFDKAKWCLWHGDPEKSLSKLEEIKSGLDDGKRKISTLITYIRSNTKNIVNYQKREAAGLSFTSNIAESTVNNLINTRQKNDGRMQWSREGAHTVLQIRSSVQSKTWENDWELIQAEIYKEAI